MLTSSRASILACLTAFVTLASQVLVHRMVSAKLINNYAFLVISLTMLGFAVSGVALTRLLPVVLRRLDEAVNACAALFALSALGVSALFYRAGTGDFWVATRAEFLVGFLRCLPLALLYAVPFAFAGLILGALLAAPRLAARRIYFWDLLGSAAGALAVLPAISLLGVETALAWACGLLVAGTAALAPPRSLGARAGTVVATLGVAAALAFQPQVFDLRYPPGSMLAAAQVPGSGMVIEHVVWDPISRIEVSRIGPLDPSRINFPALIGGNRGFLTRFRRMLTQNNFAFTLAVDYDGRPESLAGIEETIYSAAYAATSVARPRVLIIGVGGGFDILTALRHEAASITAVEVNAATVGILTRTYRDYFRHWVEDPRVHLAQGEGRHFLAASPQRYDVLQLSGVDSYSGTAGAAHVFSENYLYTAEAFDLYLDRLTDEGLLNMMRLEFVPPREMLRALATAVAALRRRGVERPADHVVMVSSSSGNFTAMLVKKTPFTPEERRRLEAWTGASPYFAVSAAPWLAGPPRGAYRALLALGSAARERAFAAYYPFDIEPVTDDRPFFFHHSAWGHLFTSAPAVQASVPVMELSLLILLTLIGAAAVLTVYLPLRWLAGQARGSGNWRDAVFFGGTGLGYLAIEIALMQKFGLFLGHPNYALSVVLAALLLASGLGALLSTRIVSALGGLRFVAYALAGVLLAEHLLALPALPGLVAWSLAARVAVAFGLVAPLGLLLGTFVPTAIEALKADRPGFVPWAWGINGIFSVLAPVLSIAFSMTFGIGALLLASIPIYLAVGLVHRPAQGRPEA